MSLVNLPPEMHEFYHQIPESPRLFEGIGELERARTQDILQRHLPPAPATVYDIGGAAGVYALWLAQLGYTVHLFDALQLHVDQALAASKAQPNHPIASCSVADAREIDRPDASADAVLFFGPLYHLIDRDDRIQALREARRILKPGGRIFAATVSRFASVMHGLAHDLVADPIFVEAMMQDLKSGQHRNPTKHPLYFTTTFFHHPDELKQEIQEAGFHFEKLVSVEGPMAILGSFAKHWNMPEKRKLLLELLRTIEEEPTLMGISDHPMGIGRK